MGANTSKGAPALPSYGGSNSFQNPINLAGSNCKFPVALSPLWAPN